MKCARPLIPSVRLVAKLSADVSLLNPVLKSYTKSEYRSAKLGSDSAISTPSVRLPLTLRGAQTVLDGRRQVEGIIRGDDDRLLVIVGYGKRCGFF